MARIINRATEKPAIRVTARQDKRRRAGLGFTREPVILTNDQIDEERMVALLSDDQLTVEIGSGEEFMPFADIASLGGVNEMLVQYREAADAHRAEAVASDTAKRGRDATAPMGGGQTGSGFVREGDQQPADPGEGAGTVQEPAAERDKPIANAVAEAVADVVVNDTPTPTAPIRAATRKKSGSKAKAE